MLGKTVTTFGLTAKDVCAIFKISNASLYDRISPHSPRYCPDFPRPIKLGKSKSSASRWSAEEVQEYIDQLTAKRTGVKKQEEILVP